MEEVWKPVVGYEGLYEVSNYGNVRSVERYVQCGRSYGTTRKFEGERKLNNSNVYHRVALSKNGKIKNLLVHRIEMEAFVPNPLNLPEVNHKDENKTNNFIFVNPDGSVDPEKSNLEWCSRSYNISYGEGAKKRAESVGKPVYMLSLEGKRLKRFVSAMKAGLFVRNKFSPHINGCANGERKTAYGYKWEWA